MPIGRFLKRGSRPVEPQWRASAPPLGWHPRVRSQKGRLAPYSCRPIVLLSRVDALREREHLRHQQQKHVSDAPGAFAGHEDITRAILGHLFHNGNLVHIDACDYRYVQLDKPVALLPTTAFTSRSGGTAEERSKSPCAYNSVIVNHAGVSDRRRPCRPRRGATLVESAQWTVDACSSEFRSAAPYGLSLCRGPYARVHLEQFAITCACGRSLRGVLSIVGYCPRQCPLRAVLPAHEQLPMRRRDSCRGDRALGARP